MTLQAVAAVLIHVTDIKAGIAWYRKAFPKAAVEHEGDFEYLSADGVQIEIVWADDKVASGPAGTVVYWRVKDFDRALEHMQQAGAVLYRGPMEIGGGLRMCQVRDPWGNCIGLRGPYPDSQILD